MGCQVPGNTWVRARPEGPWGCEVVRNLCDLASLQRTQEHLALGLRVASVSRFLGAEVSAWGARLCYTLSLRSSRVGSGIQAVRWDRSLPALLWATCQTDAQSSDSPMGSFPTWHQEGAWGDLGPVLAVSRRSLAQGSGLGAVELALHREAVAFPQPWRMGLPRGLGDLSPDLVAQGFFILI